MPKELHWFFDINPLARAIEDGRAVAILGVLPNAGSWLLLLAASALIVTATIAPTDVSEPAASASPSVVTVWVRLARIETAPLALIETTLTGKEPARG